MTNSDLSIVIPVLKLEGNPYLNGLLKALDEQTFPPKEVHLVIGDRRQGRAINFGVAQSHAKWVGTLDDDSFIEDADLLKKLVDALDNNPEFGLVGAACEIPDWATSFQKKAMLEIPRRYFRLQNEHVESDMVQHPCLVMSKELFEQIGGEDEELIRGLDPVLRKKVRDAGQKVVIVADTAVAHLLPADWKALCIMYFRNGVGSAYAQRHFPERVLELSDGNDKGSFVEVRSLPYRILRRFGCLLGRIFKGQWIVVSTDLAYGCGVMWERLRPSSISLAPHVEKVHSESVSGHPYGLTLHRVQLAEPKS
jgi:GT2 family glycosyltransferase